MSRNSSTAVVTNGLDPAPETIVPAIVITGSIDLMYSLRFRNSKVGI